MIDLAELNSSALAQLDAAPTLDAIEAVRVEFWGRKGKLELASKEFGKLTPEERARNGRLLQATKRIHARSARGGIVIELSELNGSALAQLDAAATPEAIETVRVEFWGRKGKLALASKEFGKLTPEERARNGRLLNEYMLEARGAAL